MAVTVSLESPDPIDIARVAIERVAGIAVQVGVQYKRPICGLLAAQLLLTTYDLDDSGFDEEKRLRLRLLKLLKDVQLICSVRMNSLSLILQYTLPSSFAVSGSPIVLPHHIVTRRET